jgi:type VI secretion system protein ImpM
MGEGSIHSAVRERGHSFALEGFRLNMGYYPALFGKLPSKGDFVDRNIESHLLPNWDRLLSQCFDDMIDVATAKSFIIGPGDLGDTWRVGSVTPSRDKVGRAYPVTLFVDGLTYEEAVFWASQISSTCVALLRRAQAEAWDTDRVLSGAQFAFDDLNVSLVSGLSALCRPTVSPQATSSVLADQNAPAQVWWQQYFDDIKPVTLPTGNLPDSNWDDIELVTGSSHE